MVDRVGLGARRLADELLESGADAARVGVELARPEALGLPVPEQDVNVLRLAAL